MSDLDRELIAARAVAEQEMAHVSRSLDMLLSWYAKEKGKVIAEQPVDTFSLLATKIQRSAGPPNEKVIGHLAGVIAVACARLSGDIANQNPMAT